MHTTDIGLRWACKKSVTDTRRPLWLNPGMSGFEELFKDGKMASYTVSYENPHILTLPPCPTGIPQRKGREYGWVGRLADNLDSTGHQIFWLT